MLCPFKKKTVTNTYTDVFGHTVQNTIESFIKCDKRDCSAYNNIEQCVLINKRLYIKDK